MATLTQHSFQCPACGTGFVVQGHDLINVREHPELKASVISGDLFLQTCPKCGRRHLVTWPLVYLDPEEMVLLMLSDKPLALADTVAPKSTSLTATGTVSVPSVTSASTNSFSYSPCGSSSHASAASANVGLTLNAIARANCTRPPCGMSYVPAAVRFATIGFFNP